MFRNIGNSNKKKEKIFEGNQDTDTFSIVNKNLFEI